jgi:hypothetical protein
MKQLGLATRFGKSLNLEQGDFGYKPCETTDPKQYLSREHHTVQGLQ